MNALSALGAPVPIYALAEDVFACLAEGHVFFLDLKRDRYCALEAARTAGLAALVAHWPMRTSMSEKTLVSAADRSLAQSLVRKGLLRETLSPDNAMPASIPRPTIELPSAPFPASGGGIGTSIVKDILTILAFFIAAAIRFRCSSLATLVNRVRRNREARSTNAKPPDLVRVRQLIDTFRKLRPLLFTSRNACLFESYVLLEILFHRGIYPNWVFGIQPTPFLAHCWLQHGAILLSDPLERIDRLSPIMIA